MRRTSIVVAALAVLAACSSYERVPGSGVISSPNGSAALGSTDSSGGASSSGGATATSGTVAGGAGGGGAASGAASGGAIGPGDSSAGGGGGSTGTGASIPGSKKNCVVKVGATYSSDVSAALAGAGDPSAAANYGGYVKALQAEYQAGADHVNATGGIAGCRMEMAYYDFRSLSADGFDAESQRECTSLAQDQHVNVAFIYGLETRTIIDCLARHKIPVSYHGGEYTVPRDLDYSQYRGYLYQETGISTDRWGSFIDDLHGAGYFDKGSKVGILLADDGNGNNQHLVNDIWKPKLAALGFPNPVVFTFTQLKGYSAIGDTQAQLSSAVFDFKRQGVDHVIVTPDSGNAVLLFPQNAENQGYHPRYGFTSVNYPELMKNAPADQALRAMSVSFFAIDAENAGQMTTNYPNPARTACDTLFKGKTNGGPAPYLYCDFMTVLTTALRGAPAFSPAALEAGIDRLGTSITGTANYGGTRFMPGHGDGGASVRVMSWDPTIKDFRYVTGPLNVP